MSGKLLYLVKIIDIKKKRKEKQFKADVFNMSA